MSQKIENMLNLALEATEEERSRSEELEVGYDPVEKEWELIIKYSGDVEAIRRVSVSLTELMNGYAVAVVRESRIEELAALSEVEFVEKPKSLYFQAENGRRVSCIDPVQAPPLSLTGRGTLVGIVDSGIDLEHPAFRNEDGTTRILALWDQSLPGDPPEGYSRGSEYEADQINALLGANTGKEGQEKSNQEEISSGRTEPSGSEAVPGLPVHAPGEDISGHGTAVAGIAAGNGRGSEGRRLRGAAPEAGLIVVKMGAARQEGFPRTTELMEGVDYLIRKALELRMPIAVNISFGNTYGSHEPYN